MDRVDGVLSKIRVLSTEKDQLTQQLEAENDSMRATVDKITAERDAFISENQAVIQLLMEHGIHQSLTNSRNTATLQSSVEKLVREREQQKTAVGELRSKNAQLHTEKETLAREKKQLIAENKSCRERVRGLETEVLDLQQSVMDNRKRRERVGNDKKMLQAKVLIYNTIGGVFASLM